MYFSEGLMLVKVEMRHNGDTRTPRKCRTKKSLSANMSAYDNTDKEAHRHEGPDERRLGGARKEEHSLCTNTLTLDRHVDRFYVDDTVHKTFGGKGGGGRTTGWRNSLSETHPKLVVHYLRLARARSALPNIAR